MIEELNDAQVEICLQELNKHTNQDWVAERSEEGGVLFTGTFGFETYTVRHQQHQITLIADGIPRYQQKTYVKDWESVLLVLTGMHHAREAWSTRFHIGYETPLHPIHLDRIRTHRDLAQQSFDRAAKAYIADLTIPTSDRWATYLSMDMGDQFVCWDQWGCYPISTASEYPFGTDNMRAMTGRNPVKDVDNDLFEIIEYYEGKCEYGQTFTAKDLAVFREKAMAGYVSTIYFDGL